MTSVPCRDVAVLFSTAFYVATSFMLSATNPWSQLPFSCYDLKLFVFSLSYRDLNFAHPVATSLLNHNNFNCIAHSYHSDMNSRLRPRLMSSAYIFVVTSVLACYQQYILFVSRPQNGVTALSSLEVPPILVSASSLLSQ